jgi:hypothetical protein
MKKIFLFLLTAALFCNFSFAGEGESNVSYHILTHFRSTYTAGSDVHWFVNRNFTKAAFTNEKGQLTEVFYSPESELIGVSTTIALKEVPAKALESILEKNKGYTPTQAISFEKPAGGILYYVKIENLGTVQVLEVTPEGKVSRFE